MSLRKLSDKAAELTRQAQAQTDKFGCLVAHRSVAVPQMTRVSPKAALTLSAVALMIPCKKRCAPLYATGADRGKSKAIRSIPAHYLRCA
jgi:hypothetical protein